VEARRVFRGRRIELLAGEVVLPTGERVYREYIRHPGAVVVVAENARGEVLLLRQFRAPVNEWVLEFPAGTLEANEDPRETALRELREEAGVVAGRIKHLVSFYTSPGISNEIIHAFVARDLEVEEPSVERGELISELIWVGASEMLDLIRSNAIKDAKTIASFLYYYLFERGD